MSIVLSGINNINEYYTNHYLVSVFEENVADTIHTWNEQVKESEEVKTPWSRLKRLATQFYTFQDRYKRSPNSMQTLINLRTLADGYLSALSYSEAAPEMIAVDESLQVPVYLEMKKSNGAPLLWVILMASDEEGTGILESRAVDTAQVNEDVYGTTIYKGMLGEITGENLATDILFGQAEPPRFLLFISMNQIALIDRNKWNNKRYLEFDMLEIFKNVETSTLQAMSVLLHKDSLCPDDGRILLDQLDEESQKNASGVSQDLKYALRESIEILGNEVLYDMKTRQGRDLERDPVDAGQLTIECLRYMYRMLFVLFIESRPELGYTPIREQIYASGYSLESLRDIADSIRDDIDNVGEGYYLHETLAKLYDLIYNGYPKTEEELQELAGSESLHDVFRIAPLKAHIFDPEYTKMLTQAKLRNSAMLRIIELMSLTRPDGKKNSRRGRISYANLGINQMGAVYEALLSYRGFIAEQDLYEVKKKGEHFDELDVGYFVPESELSNYDEDERVRYEHGENKGQLRMYRKGTFIYRLAGREREKSASYYTPEVLTKCLVKYALKELLKDKSADDILNLTICEPAMGSAAFLNEAINQLSEAYVSKKEQETGEIISYSDRFNEIQKVKMFIADRNVYGIDLNPVAVELAEVSLWLNTIYKDGFVPWFGTQLVNGNSLIGARRQVYRVESLSTNSKGLHWYENAPDRVPLGTKRMPRKQVYHFLLGDPGMCDYSDKVIKGLEPENIKAMKEWNKRFTAPYDQDDIETLLRLSTAIDKLWDDQVNLRKKVQEETQDQLNIYGHKDNAVDSHTTIRQKDEIFSKLYKSEHMRNAGPYARLKFAMDYWCALWFWPIDKADLLPSRSEFLFDMSLIFEGTMAAVRKDTSGQISLDTENLDLGISKTETEKLVEQIIDTYGTNTVVDIPKLRAESPRLDLAAKIAEQNKFMHWELEFADLFAEKGGFDLVIGNPPWIQLGWNEQGLLSDKNPMFAVKKLNAVDTAKHRREALLNNSTRSAYLEEYESISGQQAFYNAAENYKELNGMKANLYKCFLPQAWRFCNDNGVSAFVHPDSVYDDPKGGDLREELYPKLRKHFQFSNELKLFDDIDHHTIFGLNIYSNLETHEFESIGNLYAPSTVDESYGIYNGETPGIKDENGNWNIKGNYGRVIHISKKELLLFANLFDGNNNWKQARLPVMHAQDFIEVLERFTSFQNTLGKIDSENISYSVMFDEAADANAGVLMHEEHFPKNGKDCILSGPNIGLGNPFFKACRRTAKLNSDYDPVDLTAITENYFARCIYRNGCSNAEYLNNISTLPWGGKYNSVYRIAMRRMLNTSGERTLIPCIIVPGIAHINGVYSIALVQNLSVLAGTMASIPYDFYVKISGKTNGGYNIYSAFPLLDNSIYAEEIAARALLLNSLTAQYSELWKNEFCKSFNTFSWSKNDKRLLNSRYSNLKREWEMNMPLRQDYERRQALIELDVLTSLGLGITLEELKTIYNIQFPVLKSYEMDTWYDSNGRITFTNNRSLVGVGFTRAEWENKDAVIPVKRGLLSWDGIMKDAPQGYVFERTIIDDTMPGGPVQRTIQYVAPFDRCDREKDYETAWKFFEEKYKNVENN